jgi:hypothetical protein
MKGMRPVAKEWRRAWRHLVVKSSRRIAMGNRCWLVKRTPPGGPVPTIALRGYLQALKRAAPDNTGMGAPDPSAWTRYITVAGNSEVE